MACILQELSLEGSWQLMFLEACLPENIFLPITYLLLQHRTQVVTNDSLRILERVVSSSPWSHSGFVGRDRDSVLPNAVGASCVLSLRRFQGWALPGGAGLWFGRFLGFFSLDTHVLPFRENIFNVLWFFSLFPLFPLSGTHLGVRLPIWDLCPLWESILFFDVLRHIFCFLPESVFLIPHCFLLHAFFVFLPDSFFGVFLVLFSVPFIWDVTVLSVCSYFGVTKWLRGVTVSPWPEGASLAAGILVAAAEEAGGVHCGLPLVPVVNVCVCFKMLFI